MAENDKTGEVDASFVSQGNFKHSMPPWGIGNNDGAGASLTKAEIDKVISYVQSPGAQARYNKSQSGKVMDGSLAK